MDRSHTKCRSYQQKWVPTLLQLAIQGKVEDKEDRGEEEYLGYQTSGNGFKSPQQTYLK